MSLVKHWIAVAMKVETGMIASITASPIGWYLSVSESVRWCWTYPYVRSTESVSVIDILSCVKIKEKIDISIKCYHLHWAIPLIVDLMLLLCFPFWLFRSKRGWIKMRFNKTPLSVVWLYQIPPHTVTFQQMFVTLLDKKKIKYERFNQVYINCSLVCSST